MTKITALRSMACATRDGGQRLMKRGDTVEISGYFKNHTLWIAPHFCTAIPRGYADMRWFRVKTGIGERASVGHDGSIHTDIPPSTERVFELHSFDDEQFVTITAHEEMP